MKILKPQDLKQSTSAPNQGVWIVNGLLRTNRKRISLLCGSPHAGKSTLARQLAVAVAQGKDFLDRTTVKTKVAYWQSEESEQDAAEDFTKSGMTLDDNIVILHSDPQDNNLAELDKVLTADPDISLVILETLDDFLKVDDLDKNPNVRRAFEKFDADVLSKHMDVCFIALHHFKKSDEQRGMSMNKILGATVIAGKTDCKIYLRKVSDSDNRRVISAQTRKGVPIEPGYLDFDDMTQWSTLGQTLADERADAKKVSFTMTQEELKQRCIAVVAHNPGVTQGDACVKVGGKKQTANDMFKALIDDGTIVQQVGGATKTAHLLYVKGEEPHEPTRDELTAELEFSKQRLVRAREYAVQYPTNPQWQKEVPSLEQAIVELSKKLEVPCVN
jgi:hypothetical protein